MAELIFSMKPLWVRADLDAEPEAWARRTVQRRAEEDRVQIAPQRLEQLTEIIVVHLRAARAETPRRPLGLFFYYPFAEDPVGCAVSLRYEVVHPSQTLEQLVEDAYLPDEALEQPRFQERIRTRAGEAIHLVQRHRSPLDPHTEEIQEAEAFYWIHPDRNGVPLLYIFSTSYTDLAAAAENRSDLVVLAQGFAITPGAGDR